MEGESVVFQIEEEQNLGEVECPECGKKFDHIERTQVPISYKIKVLIRHDKDSATSVVAEPEPFYKELERSVYPENVDELKKLTRYMMEKYKAHEGYILGLGPYIEKFYHAQDVDFLIDDAIKYSESRGYQVTFEKL